MAENQPDPYRAPVLVLTAGPVTYLAELGYVQRLALLNQIAVPETVLSQVARTGPELVARLRATIHLMVGDPQPPFANRARQAGIRDQGIAGAVGLALQSHGVAVLDDAAGQRAASSLGLPLANSLGLLDQLHRVGLAGRPLPNDLRRMRECGFVIPPRVVTAMRSGDLRWLREAVAEEALILDWVGPAQRLRAARPSAGPEVEELQR
jgi:predicted nucleic acid-binding protein